MAAEFPKLQQFEDSIQALANHPHPQNAGLIGESQEFANIKKAADIIIMKTLHRDPSYEVTQHVARILRDRKYALVYPYFHSRLPEGPLEDMIDVVEDGQCLLDRLVSREETIVVVLSGDVEGTRALEHGTSWAELRTILADELTTTDQRVDPSQVQLRWKTTDQRVDDLSIAQDAQAVSINVREGDWQDVVNAWPEGVLKSFVLKDIDQEWVETDEFPCIVEYIDKLQRSEVTRGSSSRGSSASDPSVQHELKHELSNILRQASNASEFLFLLKAEFD